MREKLPDGNSEVVAVGGAHWRPASTGAPDSPSDVGDALKSVLSGDATPGVSCGLLSTSERELVNSPIIQTAQPPGIPRSAKSLRCSCTGRLELSILGKNFLKDTRIIFQLAPTETVSVKLFAMSSGKTSESHTFLCTAASTPPQPSTSKIESISSPLTNGDTNHLATSSSAVSLAVDIASSSKFDY
ncbi:hypothetical protein ALC60_09888 [Trachymyrmex zeteki]|uniref:Uncharacterized protein n=1 Tax=Mycetomoellerius zeteki TaxID=64791 RepID=A0A151WT76_9HYME|nr:hypothetical protein ALC60_09888 [Trachymyrmex zeteki]